MAELTAGPESFGLDLVAPSNEPLPTTPEGKAWEKVEAEIMLLNAPDHQIATVWHPAARGEIVTTTHGNVRVLVGDKAEYQLTSGDIIAL
ncbi:hypothetical protein [Variovorax paradoxus]|uniref:hypothetical protein n=1 Tax=Variovorax paradoxus TaxID=34073 RepID=UPI00248015B3|nr:hypothetical protein [Variovorax paradoxus]WGT64790.1 hypothetical protein QHG62_05465 [Variovorax paradoxus]